MSGVADIPAGLHFGAHHHHEVHKPLRFGEYLRRINLGEQVERAAERRSALAAGGEDCRPRCHAPAARQAGTPRLAEVSPVPLPYTPPIRVTPRVTIQQLLPIGSIIDVTV